MERYGRSMIDFMPKHREQDGREASPSAGVIDSQSMESDEKRRICIDPNGYDPRAGRPNA